MPDHDHCDEPSQRIHLIVSADPPLLQVLQQLAAGPGAHLLALRARAISAHLTTVTAELQKLSHPTPGE